MRFQILSLSGGGYRGLFTIELLSLLERHAGRPIGSCFDLIAGTSIGGIIAIGLAMGKTAEQIKAVFMRDGEDIFPPRPAPRCPPLKYIDLYKGLVGGPRYDGKALRTTVEGVVGVDTLLGEARTRLIVPAVNMTAGKLQMFKTPHHRDLTVDRTLSAVDVAMATSAAPLFFPLARVGNSLYADGGLAANSPDACAIHEAIYFCDRSRDEVHVLSIGTTSAGFGLPSSLGAGFGALEWLSKNRLVTTVFGVQQQLVDYMVGHDLGGRYLRLDEVTSAEHATDLGLDVASPASRDTLLGLAQTTYQRHCRSREVVDALGHEAPAMSFRLS